MDWRFPMNEPNLRLRAQDGTSFEDWEDIPFGELLEQYSEKTKTNNEDILLSCAIDGMYLNSELFSHQRASDNTGYLKVDKGTLILSAQNLHLGNANVNMRFDHGIISPAYKTFHLKGCLPEFMAQWVKREEAKKFFYDATTTGASQCRRNVEWETLYEQPIMMPSINEQKVIVDFFALYDQKIDIQREKVKALETRKKGLLQQIFSQEIRLKADDGSEFEDWDYVLIEDTFDPISDKNHPEATVLTIIQGQGTISREESDRNISYNKNSIPTYKLVKINDFIMHLRSFEGGLEIATKEGIVSPAYTILRNKIEIVPQFYRYYFRSSNFINEKLTGITEGIRDGRSINMDDFWLLEIPFPSLPEQKKIGEFLDLINEQIQVEKDKLEAIKNVKKGLLQQMFI